MAITIARFDTLYFGLAADTKPDDGVSAGIRFFETDTGDVYIYDGANWVLEQSASNELTAGEEHIGSVGGHTARPTANFTRPADTTAYASGDLVANSTTAGSVAALSFAAGRATGAGGLVRRVKLHKSGTGITNASFRVHLYQTTAPTVANGDNAAWSTDGVANYLGSVDVTVDKAFTDGASGEGAPSAGSEINFTADTLKALIEARGAYTPGNAEVFTITLELAQN